MTQKIIALTVFLPDGNSIRYKVGQGRKKVSEVLVYSNIAYVKFEDGREEQYINLPMMIELINL